MMLGQCWAGGHFNVGPTSQNDVGPTSRLTLAQRWPKVVLLAGWLWQGWRVSSACLQRSVLLATDLRTPGGAIPARAYRLSTFVGRRHPVMHLQLSLREASTFFAWDDLSHTASHRTGIFCNWIAECKGSSSQGGSIGAPWWVCQFMDDVVP